MAGSRPAQKEGEQNSMRAWRKQKPWTLTERQRQVLILICEGKTSYEIGKILKITPRTVEFHKQLLMEGTGHWSIAMLVRWAVRNLIIEP